MYIVALFVIALSLVAIAYRDFKTALISLGVILLAALLFYFLSPNDQQNQQANALSEQLVLSQSSIDIGYANGFVLKARAQNNHASETVQSIFIRSRLADCPTATSSPECLTIGEEQNLVKVRIPARQARDFIINLKLKSLSPIQGAAVWTHDIVSAQ